jgi:hypothetical protein
LFDAPEAGYDRPEANLVGQLRPPTAAQPARWLKTIAYPFQGQRVAGTFWR